MNTADTLIGTLAQTITLHAGQHAKTVPAGTPLEFRAEAFENSNACVYVRVVGHPRISGVVYKSALASV